MPVPRNETEIARLSQGEIEASLARLRTLARIMDSAFAVPGTSVRMGLDALLGIIPVAGDLLGQLISSYLIWEAKRLGVSRFTLWRMVANSAIDTVTGFIPVAGDAFDVAFRANSRNLALLEAHLTKQGYDLTKPVKAPSVKANSAGPGGRSGPVIDGTATRIR